MTLPIQYRGDGTTLEGDTPVVILGPNGSGKTRYGLQLAAWSNADTISALRNIALPPDIPMQSVTQAEQELTNHSNRRRKQPWGMSSEINNLFAKLMAEDAESAIAFRESFGTDASEPEVTKLMQLKSAWQTLFPGRHIDFKGYKPTITSEYVAGETSYAAQSMSDGERVALYLAGRVLDAKPGIIIVDEPEVHFHSRLAIKFWNHLENVRSDCRFVYITHDLPFALSRNTNDFLIIRPGNEPELVNVADGIPEQIAEEILAAASFSIFAERIVFCEGVEGSYDQRFYQAWFTGRANAVVPVGSCGDVVRCATAFHESTLLAGVTAIGIVDRDYWPDRYLENLPAGVSSIPAHEIESLFCIKSVFLAIAAHLGHDPGVAEELYESFQNEATSRFTGGLFWKQVSERFRNRCKEYIDRSFSAASVDGSEADIKGSHCSSVAPSTWEATPEQIFDTEKATVEAATQPPYEKFLLVLPGKVYLAILARQLGMDKDAYVDLVVDALNAEEGEQLGELGVSIRIALRDDLPDG